MAVEPVRRLAVFWRLAGFAAGLSSLIGVLLVFALPGPPARKYPDRIPVRFWHMWTSEWKVVVERIVDRYNESQTTYEVVPLSIPAGGAATKFLLAVAGGDPPDVMAQWLSIIPTWSQAGLLTPLDELMTPAERERFEREAYPVAKKIGSYDGRLYGLTIGLSLFACYYRADHFREAGLDPDKFPATMEDLVAAGVRLDRFDDAGNLARVGFLPELYGRCLPMCAPAFAGGFYDWTRKELTLNTPANRRTLEFMAECRKRYGFDKLVRFNSSINSGVGVDWPFISGAYSVVIDGQWRIDEIARHAPQLDYRVALLPPPRGGRARSGLAGGNFMIIPRGARQSRGAWEFVKFWSGLENPERAAEFHVWGGWLPFSPAVVRAPAYHDYIQKYPAFGAFVELLASENLEPPPPVAFGEFLQDSVRRAEDYAARGLKSPAEALGWLEAQVAVERAKRKELGYAE